MAFSKYALKVFKISTFFKQAKAATPSYFLSPYSSTLKNSSLVLKCWDKCLLAEENHILDQCKKNQNEKSKEFHGILLLQFQDKISLWPFTHRTPTPEDTANLLR
jgi:hypothetical protein